MDDRRRRNGAPPRPVNYGAMTAPPRASPLRRAFVPFAVTTAVVAATAADARARAAAFAAAPQPWSSRSRRGSSATALSMAPAALTERQLQFWEDVEDGLDDVGAFYAESRRQDIDRIRAFGRSARGEIPRPSGYAPRHEPSEEHVPDLTAKPFWDTSENPDLFPWAAELESQSHVIIDEFREKLASREEGKGMFASDSAWQNDVMGAGWSAVRLQRLGAWNSANCAEFPRTYELLRKLDIPLAVRGVCFARQGPRSGVGEHSDGRNFILTSHLGLVVPEGCWIQVGDERRTWTEGKLTTLDTSFVHSTSNPSDRDRHVLILDFWHPELTEAERAALEFVYDLRNRYESGEVPVRRPRGTLSVVRGGEGENEGGGLGGLWKSLTGGRDD